MIAISLVALALSATASASPALKLTIDGAKSFAGVDKAVVSATLTNTGDEVLRILNEPNTILSKFETNTFQIENADGVAPRFFGKIVKYIPTVESSATVLAPGANVTVKHSLADAYDFTHSGVGEYSIVTSPIFKIVTDAGIETIAAETYAHEAKISGTLYKPLPALDRRATYSSCTSSEQSSLATAATNAQSYAASALSYLQSHTATSTRFVTWFGTWTSAHRTTVLSHFTSISGGSFSSYTYDCSCTESDTYAYTYAAQTGKIYLCGAFWSAPATGTDSKAGTLIHESSHWTAYGGTQDYAYGQTAAKSLATSNSAHAILNADSHEYFAENNPALS